MASFVEQFTTRDLLGFVAVLARLTPLFVFAPTFSNRALPARGRAVVAVGLAIGITPLALHGQRLPTAPVAVLGMIVEGLLVGGAFAFAFAVLFGALESAGSFLDFSSGLSYGDLINPQLGIEGSVFAELYTVIGTLVFVAIGGIEWLVRGIAKTFSIVPITGTVRVGSLVGGTEQVFATIFTSALEVIAPVVVAMAITDIAFGVLSRVVPQMNIFSVGFPIKVVVAVLVAAATLPFVGNWLLEGTRETLGTALSLI
jgi:flagellar biosynthetic protein FliR